MKKRILAVILTVAILCIGIVSISCGKPDPTQAKYEEACSLIEAKKYRDAYDILLEIKDYEPASEKLKCFSWAPQTVTEVTSTHQFGEITYTYNTAGRITSMKDGDTEYTFSYTLDGQVSYGPILYKTEMSDSGYGLEWDDNASYTYENGKLSRVDIDERNMKKSLTYEYYADGNLRRVYSDIQYLDYVGTEWEYDNWKFDYEYTYDELGRIATKTYYGISYGLHTTCTTYTYDELGRISSYTVTDKYGDTYTVKFEYNEFGIKEINFRYDRDSIDFKYTYNSSGALTKISMQSYSLGSLDDTIELEFSGNKLIYSENPAAHERIDHVTYNSGEYSFMLLAEIIW